MIFWILGQVMKWTMVPLFFLMLYNAYKYIWLPYQARKYYRKFKNVYVNPEQKFILGDASKYIEDVQNGRVNYYHQVEYALKLRNIDLRLSIIGSMIIVNVLSPEALADLQSKCPKFIDRHGVPHVSFGKLFPKAFIQIKSSANWKDRREKFMKELGINFSSRYIPTMIDAVGEQIKSWSDGESRNLLKEMADTTFDIITAMLFGKNVSEDIGELKYVDPRVYKVENLNFNDFYTRVSKDLMGDRFSIKALFFPFLSRYNIGPPYNINLLNLKRLWSSLEEHLNESKDENSVYYRLMKTGEYNKEELFHDLVSMLFAGHETSSHAIGSIMYFLHKEPKTKEKLLQELSDLKGKNHDEIRSILTKDKIEEFEYLHMVVKEGLRIDPPAPDTMAYKVVSDTEICGVPLKTGTVFNVNILPQHYNPKIWHEPLEFIPERFDSEHEYFTMPDSKKPRGPLSYIPFSFGLRKCPGQTLATLEIKIMVAYLLTRVEFEFDSSLLESDYALFSMVSNLSLDFTAKLK